MAMFYKCDKCGKEIDGTVFNLSLAPIYSTVYNGEHPEYKGEYFNLCAKCVGNFGLWMIKNDDAHGCYNCKHCSSKITQDPCDICLYNDKWEAKDNGRKS